MFAKLFLKVTNIIKREKVKHINFEPQPTSITQVVPSINDISKPISSKSQCKTCIGCGFVKTNPIICDVCKGHKCMSCNSLGLTQLPWSECPICYGSGEIIISL